jgi:hypothetical protein
LADRYFDRVLQFDPRNAEIHAMRGRNLLLGSQFRRARESFSAAMAIEKTHPLAKLGIALCDYYEGNAQSMKKELGGLRDDRPKGDKYQQYATALLAQIDTHELKEEWNEGFDRATIRAPWTAKRTEGVTLQVVQGEVRAEGQFSRTDEVKISNDIPARLFRSYEVDVKIPIAGAKPDANQTDVTVFVRMERTSQGKAILEFEASIRRERKKADGTAPITFRYRNRDETPPDKELQFNWPADKPVHVRIERNDDDSRPRGRVFLDNDLVVPEFSFPAGSGGSFSFGVSGDAESGRSCSFAIDGVRIVRKRAE